MAEQTTTDAAAPGPHHDTRPVLIAGDDGVALRVREEVAGAGATAIAICSRTDSIAALAAARDGTRVVIGDVASAATWDEAGAQHARAVGLLGGDDLHNLHAALLVADHSSDARIVVRLFATDLAPGVEGMLGGRGTVLSEIDVAAPAFVQAALSGNTGQRVTIAGHVLEVAEVDPDDPALVVALCNADTPTDVLPSRDRLSHLVLGLIDPLSVVMGARGALPPQIAQLRLAQQRVRDEKRRHRASARARLRGSLRVVPKRAFVLLAVIFLVGAISTSVFVLADHLDFLDSVYFTATTMATVGYGDVNLLGAPDWLKIYDVGLMAVSAVLLASVLAFVTDILVSSRIDRALGRFPRPAKDHVIVCGLGKAGSRILMALHELDVPCIGVEHDQGAVGIAVARQLEIPVVFEDARTPGSLDAANLATARAILAVTSDDLANLQCGLAAREHNPAVRIVLRIFDPTLAARLDNSVELDLTRSISALAAPAFSAALLDRHSAVALPLSNVPLRVLETHVPDGSALVGRLIRDVHRDGELRILALNEQWRPRDDLSLQAGAQIAVVGTRHACDELLAA
jgi:Trk K+ transport system NAD-binding subunit